MKFSFSCANIQTFFTPLSRIEIRGSKKKEAKAEELVVDFSQRWNQSLLYIAAQRPLVTGSYEGG